MIQLLPNHEMFMMCVTAPQFPYVLLLPPGSPYCSIVSYFSADRQCPILLKCSVAERERVEGGENSLLPYVVVQCSAHFKGSFCNLRFI